MNYSAVSLDLLTSFEMEQMDHLHITNSISEDIKYLRRLLLPSLIKNIKQNEGFEEKLRLFEVAKTYIPQKNSLPVEDFKLAIITNTSFDDLKGMISALFRELNIDIFESQSGGGANDLFVKDAQGQFNSKMGLFGSFGLIKTQYSRRLGISQQVYGAEFDFMKLVSEAKTMPTYHPISQFASINLDLTIPKKIPFVEIQKKAYDSAPHLVSFSLKDLYKDTITLHLTFSDSKKNMTEKEAQGELIAIKNNLS
jgi:phenylalanyl-tRNA synthetase beta chain